MERRTIARTALGAAIAAVLATGAFAASAPSPATAQVPGCAPANLDSTDVPKAIPDPGEAEATLAAPAGGSVNGLDVEVEIDHPFVSDLTIELIAPSGASVLLAEGVGMWGDDFAGTTFDDGAATSIVSELPPFTGSFRSAEPLSAFDGMARGGSWKLRVTNRHGGYPGSIEGFGLDFACEDVTAPAGQAVGISPFQRATSFRVGWAAGSDSASGVASRDVHYFAAPHRGGFGNPVKWRQGTTATSGAVTGSPGSTYCFAERLRDGSGNVSAFSPQRCAAVPLDDRALRRSRAFRRKRGRGHYLRTFSLARRRGARLSAPVTGSALALLATSCRRCGRVKVFLGGRLLRRISLRSRRLRKRRLYRLASFDAIRAGRLRIVVASRRRKVMVDGLAVLRPPVEGLPATYERVESAGAPALPPLPTGVPAGAEGIKGTLITVDTADDVLDGDTSSVAALDVNEGADDKISLREAIEATNATAGPHTVHFDPALSGETIEVTGTGLPRLLGGDLFVNGDINADGDPEIALAGDGVNQNFGLVLASSANRIHAISIRGFAVAGALLCPPPCFGAADPGQTLAGNILSGLSIDQIDAGIIVTGSDLGDVDTDNRWLDTRMTGNVVTAELSGIEFNLYNSTGDAAERTSIAGNRVSIDDDASRASLFGINLGAGLGGHSDSVTIAEALIAQNSVVGTPQSALRVSASGAGAVPGAGNLVQDIEIAGNRAELQPAEEAGPDFGTDGINVLAGDDFEPSHGDLTRNIDVRANHVEGFGRYGVQVYGACCAGTENRVENVEITDNLLEGDVGQPGFGEAGVAILGSYLSVAEPVPASSNQLTDVSVRSNTVVVEDPDGVQTGADLESGGIVMVGGEQGGPDNLVSNVAVTDNRVITDLIGLSVVGGWGLPPHGAADNEVSEITARFNLVERQPTLPAAMISGIKGISLIGGTGFLGPAGVWQSTGNTVRCVTLEGNLVAGVLDDFSLMANVSGSPGTASDNTATLGGC